MSKVGKFDSKPDDDVTHSGLAAIRTFQHHCDICLRTLVFQAFIERQQFC